jgi:redox-sensing transcriptional repressor
MEIKMIGNKRVILRFSRYRNALTRFKALGFVKIFSEYLADSVGVTSAQVRKDFSLFGISGNKRGGYQIDALIGKLNEILGKNEIQKVVLVGAGHLGSALLKYRTFEQEGIKIIAAFDIDPAKQLQKNSIPVLPVEQIIDFVEKNEIKIAILCVPDIAAQQSLDILIKAGIKGVLNFAPIELKSPNECIINNVNLAVELENLIYFVNVTGTGLNHIKQPLPPVSINC